MYSLLVEEYQSEKNVKEESRKIGLDFTSHQTVSIEDSGAKKEDETEEKETDQDELIIKNVQIVQQTTDKNDEPLDKEEEKKSVDKEDKKPDKKEEEKTDEVKEDKKTSPKVKKEVPDKLEPKKESAKPEIKPTSGKKETKEDVKKEEDKKLPEIPKTHAEKKTTKKEEEKPEEDQKGSKLKIVGKVDLEEISKKSQKKQETEKEKKKEKPKEEVNVVPEKSKAEKEAKETKEVKETKEAEEEKKTKKEEKPVEKEEKKDEDNFIKTEFKKLSGLKVIDKIDLPVEKKPAKKQPVASSSDDKPKKKKRRRIRKEVKPVSQEGGQQKGKPRPKRGKQEPQKPEVSDEEIQKQIKETLARLTPTGKSRASKHRRTKREQISKNLEAEKERQEKESQILKVTEFVTANELSSMMSISVNDIISTCMSLGLFVSINQRLDAETIALVAEEFGFKVEFVSADVLDEIEVKEDDAPEDLIPRHPIVTVMGHVDHGKTSLLDHIRKTNVIGGEAGGITQHIGAYELTLEGDKKITFLDTPGHEAFTAMRARGAKLTDVAIIVIAADDNVMPQTVEAINHAQAAGVPIVFAINKVDKPGANSEKIKEGLSQMNILVEDWGGKYQSQEISAKSGENIEALLEKVLLESELLDLKANPDKLASGAVIESSLDKGRGYVVKMLVQNGTLHLGDVVLAGSIFGKVKAMYNERNTLIKEAGPSTPVLMLGMNGAPDAGDAFNVMKDEREAKSIANKRMVLQREQGLRTQKHITLDEIGRRIAIGDFQELNVIVKGDVIGSVEALADSLLKLSTDEVQVNVIHKSVGQVSETDVNLASASNAIIVGFQVRPSLGARKLAEQEQIDIRTYSVIYNAIEEVKAAIEGMLSPDIEEKITCNIEIRDVFKISKVGTVAGCYVLDGKVTRNTKVRVIRDGIVIYTGMLGSLKRFKDDVKEVNTGYECGLNIENFNDIKVGDVIEGYEEVEIKRKLK